MIHRTMLKFNRSTLNFIIKSKIIVLQIKIKMRNTQVTFLRMSNQA